jgi:hypothetical protein
MSAVDRSQEQQNPAKTALAAAKRPMSEQIAAKKPYERANPLRQLWLVEAGAMGHKIGG